MTAEPFERLIPALDQNQSLPVGWELEWAGTGKEPLQAAWDASYTPYWMAAFLRFLGDSRAREAEAAWKGSAGTPGCTCHGQLAPCGQCADAIRRQIPQIEIALQDLVSF